MSVPIYCDVLWSVAWYIAAEQLQCVLYTIQYCVEESTLIAAEGLPRITVATKYSRISHRRTSLFPPFCIRYSIPFEE